MRTLSAAIVLAVGAVLSPPAHAQEITLIGNTPDGIIYDIDLATGQNSNPRPTGIPFLVDVASDADGVVYGLTTFFTPPENSLVEIDPSSGQWILVGDTGLPDIREGDLAIHPSTGRIYGIQNLDTSGDIFLFEIDRATGTAISSVEIIGAGDLSAMSFDVSGTLFVIDTESDSLLTVDPDTGDVLTSIGLSVGLGRGAGMDVEGSSGTMYVADGGDLGTDKLYTLDTATGSLSEVGPTGLLDGLSGVTFLTQPVFHDGFESGDTLRWSDTVP